MPAGEGGGDVGGEGTYVVEGGVTVQWDDYVQAARLGGHQQGGQFQQLGQPSCGVAHLGEAFAGRIEVEHQPVRMVGPVGLGQEAVRGGARLVGQVEEGGGVVADHVGDGAVLLAEYAGSLSNEPGVNCLEGLAEGRRSDSRPPGPTAWPIG